MSTQEDLPFDRTVPSKEEPIDEKLAEFARFTESIDQPLYALLVDIAEKVLLNLKHKMFSDCKNPRKFLVWHEIHHYFLPDFRQHWPEMSESEIWTNATECVTIVVEHLEYIRTLEPRYASIMSRTVRRKAAISRGEISKDFAMCFVPPEVRERVQATSMPDPKWLAQVTKKKRMPPKQKLRLDMAKASVAYDKIAAKRTGDVIRGKTREFGFARKKLS